MKSEEQKNTVSKSMRTSSIVVFWIESGQPFCETFDGKSQMNALAHCESLRRKARDGQPIVHVCMSADHVESVTLAGVDDKLPADYNWVKRRSAGPVGRPSGPEQKIGMKIITEKDCIDAFGNPGDTGTVFLEEFLGLNWSEVLLADLAELSDFCHRYPSSGVNFDSTQQLKMQASIESETLGSLVAAWDDWMITKIFERYGIKLESTKINLITLFRLIEASPNHGKKPPVH